MAYLPSVLVTGAGGFIGHHLVSQLVDSGHIVRGVDFKRPEYEPSKAQSFEILDLRRWSDCLQATRSVDFVYNLAANMDGIDFDETKKNETKKVKIWHDNVLINTHMIEAARLNRVQRFLYTSSACGVSADAEDDYGWEKLFSERMCRHYAEDYGLETRVLRFHNIYGPKVTYEGGREEALAAICRKVALAADNDEIEVSGDAQQARSYCYIDDCVEGIVRLMRSDSREPLNLGQARRLSMDRLVDIVADLAGKSLKKRYAIDKPQDLRAQNSDHSDLRKVLDWVPQMPLERGLEITYHWIYAQLAAQGRVPERST